MKTSEAQRSQTKSFEQPDEVRSFDYGKVELVTVAGRTVGRATFEPGWKWSTCVGPIAKTRRCEAAHFGYQLTGTIRISSDEGTIDINAGEVFSLPPGHDAWVVGSEPVVCIDFQGMVDYAKPKSEPGRHARRSTTSGRRH